jgi:hypothetical protein
VKKMMKGASPASKKFGYSQASGFTHKQRAMNTRDLKNASGANPSYEIYSRPNSKGGGGTTPKFPTNPKKHVSTSSRPHSSKM